MVSSLAPNLPPVKLSDSALKLASTLLQIAVDPNATSARLAELAAQTQVLRDAIASNETTAAGASDVEAQQAAVTAKEQDVTSREAALTARKLSFRWRAPQSLTEMPPSRRKRLHPTSVRRILQPGRPHLSSELQATDRPLALNPEAAHGQ
jgi:hypothetical protein